MKKTLFLITAVLGFFWGTMAFAWQDPCSATQYVYECQGYTLAGWQETESPFSPAPTCSGVVLLYLSDGTWHAILDYAACGDVLMIAGIPCKVDNDGSLVCKVITQPEESYDLIFDPE